MTAPSSVDPLALQTFWSRLISIVEQQAVALIRTSFTPAVSECGDISACAFDTEGRMLAQAVTGTPGHINSMARCVAHLLKVCPPETLEPGDVLVTNDPWLTSGHHYDVTIVTPVFYHNRLVAFFGNICHTIDFGGRPYGPDGVDSYEEGIEIPVLKLFKRGVPNDELFQVIQANVRLAEQVIGDLYAQVAGNAVGAERLTSFMDQAHIEDLTELSHEIISRTERGMRDAIRELPDGVYEYATEADGYGDSIHLEVAISVHGDHLTVDYGGTSSQVKQAINVVMNYTEAYTTYGLKCALARDIPNNDGIFRSIAVAARKGSILNCVRPAPVGARHLIGNLIPGMITSALAPVLGPRAMAEGAGALWSTNVHGVDWNGREFSLLTFLTGGTGARGCLDGLSSTSFPAGVSGIPVEVFENRSPLVMLRRELRPDSGGAGRFRGGLGYRTVHGGFRMRESCRVAPFTERIRNPPPGLAGGLPGASGSLSKVDGVPLDAKRTFTLSPNEQLVIETPGGGGIGPPSTRNPEAVLEDVSEGLVSIGQAREVYKVAITHLGEIDPIATAELRSAGRDGLSAEADQRARSESGT